MKSIVSAVMSLLLLSVGTARAAFVTGGVYDENVFQTNVVDTSATSDTGNQVSLATFTTLMATAFANGTGGVAHFDGSTDTASGLVAASGQTFTITYGPSQSSSIIVTHAGAGNLSVGLAGSDRTTISGSTTYPSGRILSRGTSSSFIFTFSAADQITHIGATLLSRGGGSAVGNVAGTVTFSNSTTTAVSSNIVNSNGGDDTFWGFKAPTGLFITGLSFTNLSNFTNLDDLGFVPVPEPATFVLAGLAGLGLFAVRRRKIVA